MRIERLQDLFRRYGAHRLGAALVTSAMLVPLAACSQSQAARTGPQEKTSLTAVTVSAGVTGFFPADDTKLTGTARFGAIDGVSQIYPLQVEHYTLGISLDAASSAAPVYRVDVGSMPTPDKLAARLGISGTAAEHRFGPLSIYEWSDRGLVYIPATGGYSFSPTLDQPPDASGAIASARKLLVEQGLLPADSRQQVEVTPSPVSKMFSVAFRRRIAGLPVYGSGTAVVFPPEGDVLVMATHRPLAGGSSYPLRSAEAGWTQGTARGWYLAEGILHGDPGVVVLPAFTADKAELCYLEADLNTVQQYLVPMYRFTDSRQHISLYISALSSDYEVAGIS